MNIIFSSFCSLPFLKECNSFRNPPEATSKTHKGLQRLHETYETYIFLSAPGDSYIRTMNR